MHKCNNCGTEFEGKFCPECGTRWEASVCPACGAALPFGAKFCNECGAKIGVHAEAANASAPAEEIAATPAEEVAVAAGEAPAAQPTQAVQAKPAQAVQTQAEPREKRNVFVFFTEERVRKIYRALAVAPAAMCALFSVLLFLFCLAPSAEMVDIFTGGTQSLGNVYDYATASSDTIIAFAAIGLAIAGGAFLFLFLPKIRWREIPFRRIPVWGALSALSAAVYFAPFVAACVICSDVKATDGGMSMLSVGAGPILVIVFALLFLVALGGAGCARYLIARKFPAFAEEERDMRAAEAEAHKLPVPDEQTRLVMPSAP